MLTACLPRLHTPTPMMGAMLIVLVSLLSLSVVLPMLSSSLFPVVASPCLRLLLSAVSLIGLDVVPRLLSV